MHIDKKSGEFNEENYISCILDDDATEIPPAAAVTKTPSPEILEHQKTNVIRHSNAKSPAKDVSPRNGSSHGHLYDDSK